MSKPLVSVVMLAYNQESFVGQAIESVLAQKTTFDYEIVIHDDASNDATSEIIREYEKKHPDIIKAIYQTQNQYSRNINIVTDIIYPICRGEFYAYCECDDYWCDSHKLEKQVAYLTAHGDCCAVYHNCEIVDRNGEAISNYSGPYYIHQEEDYDCFKLGLTGDMPGHTATVMVRAELFSFDGGQRIAFNEVRANGDKKLLMLLAAQNCRIHVLPDIMSAHRVVYSGGSSWTASIQGKNMSGKFFLANLDIRKYIKRYNSKANYPNCYQLFHSAIAVVVKYIKSPTSENRDVFRSVVCEFGDVFHFLLFVVAMGISSIPYRGLYALRYGLADGRHG